MGAVTLCAAPEDLATFRSRRNGGKGTAIACITGQTTGRRSSPTVDCRPPQGWENGMKLSARNVFKGKVLEVVIGPVNSKVMVDIGGGNVVTSMVTAGAVEDLGIAVGDEVHVIIKSSDVMLAK
jgi:molybdopterin-binding protein